MEGPAQYELFGAPPATERPARESPSGTPVEVVRAAPPGEEVLQTVRRLPAGPMGQPRSLHFGTSSWTFPGWVGIVYAQLYGAPLLARHGLAAYARHPLLNAVSLDSAFYKVPSTEQVASYASDVPDNFRFMVKAYAGLTVVPDSSMALRRGVEPVFLDPQFATHHVIEPLVAGLGAKLGALLFQFSPLGPRYTRSPRTFVARLGEFLSALPAGLTYAVELRDPEFLGSEYERMLRAAGAVHCSNVHARMPPVDRQVSERTLGPLLVRWMLRSGDDYESAAARFAPFSRLAEPDKLNRDRIAAMVRHGLSSGRDVHVVAANNAEGSAPLTLLELAKTIVTN
jgi:uncharacterized protein YecE (DUF72 family)